MAENIRLKDLQNDMKKMLEVVEQICLDGEKRRKYCKTTCRTGAYVADLYEK